jgi:hypothetical protein
MGVRYLADYMAATDRGRRRIILNSKYRPIAKTIQHREARSTVSKFIRDGDKDIGWLQEESERLRGRLVDDDFERAVLDHNADYIGRFAVVANHVELPAAELLPPGSSGATVLQGVRITIGLHFRLRRLTKTNKVREGAGMLRYAKGRRLALNVAAWQSAFILAYLRESAADQNIDPEGRLCLVIDAYAGVCHSAPGDSISRLHNMRAACASIAEQWPNVQPPPGAVY